MSTRYDPEHPVLFGREEGRRLRDEGVRRITLAVMDDPWWNNAIRAVKAQLGPFSSDEIRSYAGDPPRPNALGALFRHIEQAGLAT